MNAWVILLSCCAGTALAADFNVISPGSFYSINGMSPNPVLTLVRGETYTFAISTASNHPFQIVSPAGTTTNNNISSGTITFRVPTNAANYRYRCSVHGFGAQIVTIPPPAVNILNLTIGNELTLRSTGASNYSVLPEFKTNVASTNWFALTVRTNRFLTGTNETICGRPPDGSVFIRIKAQRR
jgi:hypothetical protein